MFKIKVKVKEKKLPVLTVERVITSRSANAIAIPDTYLSAIENARKAETRAIHRLVTWIRLNDPSFYSKNNLHLFTEDDNG